MPPKGDPNIDTQELSLSLSLSLSCSLILHYSNTILFAYYFQPHDQLCVCVWVCFTTDECLIMHCHFFWAVYNPMSLKGAVGLFFRAISSVSFVKYGTATRQRLVSVLRWENICFKLAAPSLMYANLDFWLPAKF